MRTPQRLHARAKARLSVKSFVFLLAAAVAAAAAALLSAPSAHASSGLCANGLCGSPTREVALERRGLELQTSRRLAEIADEDSLRRGRLSDQEFFSFSGVGAIVCTVKGEQRTATAFLVGAFDIGVTVAHTFVDDGAWVEPQDCVYTTTDSLGQVRERIPVAYIKSEWQSEAGALGQVAKDLAVIRLVEPSRFAQRTMPLGKFSGLAANVLMVGFKADLDSGAVKVKTTGRVYDGKSVALSSSSLAGFMHDMNASDIAAGAPVIDEHSGVIIGIHTQDRTRAGTTRNTMITMNEWLETTLRSEMQVEAAARVN
jgi:hypothetical protein